MSAHVSDGAIGTVTTIPGGRALFERLDRGPHRGAGGEAVVDEDRAPAGDGREVAEVTVAARARERPS
jgi:hypothetical protein